MVSADCSNESLVRRMPANKHQRIREKKSDKAPDTRSTLRATRQLPASHLLHADKRSHNLNCSKFILNFCILYWRSRILTPQELCWFQISGLLKQPLTKFQPKVIGKIKLFQGQLIVKIFVHMLSNIGKTEILLFLIWTCHHLLCYTCQPRFMYHTVVFHYYFNAVS